MHKADIIVAITTLLTQAENGYYLSNQDILDAEAALDVTKQILDKAKREIK